MQPDVKDDESIRAYLLGAELPADTQDGIEQRLIADDDYFERVRSIEDEIIDSYLGGELTSDEVGLFRHHFLRSSRHQERLRLYESWTRAGARQQNSQRRLPGSPPEITSWWKLMVAAMSKHRSLALASALAVFLARIIREVEDARSLFCYKHVVKAVFVLQERLPACSTIARHSVCYSPTFSTSLPYCSSTNGWAVPMAGPFC